MSSDRRNDGDDVVSDGGLDPCLVHAGPACLEWTRTRTRSGAGPTTRLYRCVPAGANSGGPLGVPQTERNQSQASSDGPVLTRSAQQQPGQGVQVSHVRVVGEDAVYPLLLVGEDVVELPLQLRRLRRRALGGGRGRGGRGAARGVPLVPGHPRGGRPRGGGGGLRRRVQGRDAHRLLLRGRGDVRGTQGGRGGRKPPGGGGGKGAESAQAQRSRRTGAGGTNLPVVFAQEVVEVRPGAAQRVVGDHEVVFNKGELQQPAGERDLLATPSSSSPPPAPPASPLLDDPAPRVRGVHKVPQVVVGHDDPVRLLRQVQQEPEGAERGGSDRRGTSRAPSGRSSRKTHLSSWEEILWPHTSLEGVKDSSRRSSSWLRKCCSVETQAGRPWATGRRRPLAAGGSRTCGEAVPLLAPLGDEDGDVPVAPPPKRLHGQRDSPAGEEPVEAVTAERRGGGMRARTPAARPWRPWRARARARTHAMATLLPSMMMCRSSGEPGSLGSFRV